MDKSISELKHLIEKSESIVIFSHVNPDGDTLGSNLALKIIIQKFFNKTPDSVCIGYLPEIYRYLPEYEKLKRVEDIDLEKQYDLAIAVDVAAKDRLVNCIKVYDNAKVKVNIDHHVTNNSYGDINIIDGKAACAGAILYKIFRNWETDIPQNAARCLYTSLMTDTGGFRYENTTADTFIMASELVKLGVSPTEEYRACYETKPQNMVQFQAYIVNNALFLNNGKISAAKVTKKDMDKFNATDDYTEGIVEVLRTSRDVEISALLKETKEGYTKVSLRSKTKDLTKIALDFNGGGHRFAAGCTIKKPIDIAFEKLIKRIQLEIE